MKPWKPLIFLTSVVALGLPAPAEIIERVVATVNGDIVTLSEFTARQVAEAQAARVTPDRIEQFLRENNARILQAAIDDLLIVQKAEDLGFRLRPDYIDEVVQNIKKENNIESDEAFLAQLEREGMSLDDLRRSIERSILSRQVISREIDAKVQVSEQDVRAAYEAARERYTTPARLRLQEILVPEETGLSRASELVARARAGADFAELARAHSSSASREAGGELGDIAHGDLSPSVEKAAFGLEPGGVSDPIPLGAGGFLILRLAGRHEGHVTPFEEVKAEITRQLQQERRAAEYESFLAKLRESAIIDVKVREVALQVDLPSSGSLLDVPAAELEPSPAPARRIDPEDEFTVTPQARPERVAPAPAPSPTPTPTPPPR